MADEYDWPKQLAEFSKIPQINACNDKRIKQTFVKHNNRVIIPNFDGKMALLTNNLDLLTRKIVLKKHH
jgi:hypothetical protein